MNNEGILLSPGHCSQLIRLWIEKGRPKIPIVYGVRTEGRFPAETILGLGKFLSEPRERSRLLTVLSFLGWESWPKEERVEWEMEFNQQEVEKPTTMPARRAVAGKGAPVSQKMINTTEVIIMGDIKPEEAKLVLEVINMTLEVLLKRVADGNDKLVKYAAEVMQEKDNDTWNELMDNLKAGVARLNLLCHVLETKGYHDCLYIENGKKVRSCLSQEHDNVICWACPSSTKYWEIELFGTEKKEVPFHSNRNKKLMDFIKAGGKL